MEEDRAETDLGVAVDVEEALEEEAARKAPKKRFVGRRQATEAAAKSIPNGAVEDSTVIQSKKVISYLCLEWALNFC
jgi:2-(3-amino-3-carboxypropyl)histidine synthase